MENDPHLFVGHDKVAARGHGAGLHYAALAAGTENAPWNAFGTDVCSTATLSAWERAA